MSGVIDLRSVREERAALEVSVKAAVGELAKAIVSLALSQAERAFAVSSPLAKTDLALCRAVNQYVRRDLRRSVRKLVPDPASASLRNQAVEEASLIYRSRLIALIDERDAEEARHER